ncbi:MAG: MaoC family dehydratase [Acidimicrobiia bacterium]
MSENGDDVYVGRYLGERALEITSELVQQYSDAVEDHNPCYSADSPFGQPVAPALLLHSEVYRTLSWYLPRIYGNLHARQEWDLFHPAMVGEMVTTRSLVIDRYIKRDREYVVNEVTCFGIDGRTLNRGRTHQSFLIDAQTAGVVVDKQREKRSERRFEVGEGAVIEEIAGPAKEVTLEMCQRFSGPRKTYHTDVEEARKLGFPDIVVQGMMPLCFVSEMMTSRFREGWFAGGRMNVALVNVLWRGDVVTARGIVREVTTEGARCRAQLEVWCEKADGTKVVVGTASALT